MQHDRCHMLFIEQDLLAVLEHLKSPKVFSEISVAQSSVFNVVFCILLFVFWSFSFF